MRTLLLCTALALVACDDKQSTAAADDAGPHDAVPADAHEAAPDVAIPDAAVPDAAPPDAAPDATPPDAGPPASHPRFDPAGGGFYDTPWPSDARLTAAGTPDLSSFQTRGATLPRVIQEIEANVRGYATMPIAYIAFDDAIADLPLPTPTESTDRHSPIQLIELGAGCGHRVPVEASVRAADGTYIAAQTLQVKNTVGVPLKPRTPYGLVVLRTFGAAQGRPAARPRAFDAAWAGDGSPWAEALRKLRECAPVAGLDPDEVAVATVFTPQDPVSELQAMRDLVMDPARVETRPPMVFAHDGAWSRRRLHITTYSGLVEMPVLQDGAPPYLAAGGAVVFGPDGVPAIQRWEPVPFAVAMRDLDPPPAGPRPVLVFMDGTGWDPWDHLRSAWLGRILDAGFVVFSFMPQFHGGRAGTMGGPEFATFNFTNPAAGRNNFREQATETAYFLRVIREQLANQPGLPPLDTSRIVYGGHSQGALVGALTAAIEPGYQAFVLNGLSSYLTLTILDRKDLLDFERTVRGFLNNDGPLDLFSPPLQLMQLAGEVVDPHNYARLWRGTPSRPQGTHVFVINGHNDDTTTPRGIDNLTISGDLPTLDPPGWDIDPLGIGAPPTVPMPVHADTQSVSGEPLTIATYLDPNEGHFTVWDNPTVQQMAIKFWQTALSDGVPTLQSTHELMCADGGDDDGDGLVDCADDDCAQREPCVETVCDDGQDGDHDGMADCADPDCHEAAPCQEMNCGDGLDDDGDGVADCADPGCAQREPCREVLCRDGLDGDGDGLVDCADPDCSGLRVCHEIDCGNQIDDDGDGLVDCADDECLRSPICPEPACDDGTDEDGNGLADCADPRCAGTDACPVPAETVCDDTADDDGDGLIDCADPDCAVACHADACADGDLGQALGVAVFQGTLEGRPDTWDPGDCTGLGTGKDAPDLSLRWTAPASGVYVVSTLGSEADTVLTMFPPDCDHTREFVCNDDVGGDSSSQINLQIDAGQSVVIVISAFEATEAKAVRLNIYPLPAE
jgi:hypothetical protein